MSCGPFASDEHLRAVFVDSRIRPWRDQLPEAESHFERVTRVIAFLADRQNESVLVLTLKVLSELHDENDNCRSTLIELATELERIVKSTKQNAYSDSVERSRADINISPLLGALSLQKWKSLKEVVYQGVKFDLVGEQRKFGTNWQIFVAYQPEIDEEAVLEWRSITATIIEKQAKFNQTLELILTPRRAFILVLLTNFIPLGTETVLQRLLTDDFSHFDRIYGGGQVVIVADLNKGKIYSKNFRLVDNYGLVRNTHKAIETLFNYN